MEVVLAGSHCQRARLSYLKSGDAGGGLFCGFKSLAQLLKIAQTDVSWA